MMLVTLGDVWGSEIDNMIIPMGKMIIQWENDPTFTPHVMKKNDGQPHVTNDGFS